MGAETREPCVNCGLLHPCAVCGVVEVKPRLAAVPAGWSREEVLAGMRKAFELGFGIGADATATRPEDDAQLVALLEDLIP